MSSLPSSSTKPPLLLIILLVIWGIVFFIWMFRKESHPAPRPPTDPALQERIWEKCMDSYEELEDKNQGEQWGSVLSNVGLFSLLSGTGGSLGWMFKNPITSSFWIVLFLLTAFLLKKWLASYFENDDEDEDDATVDAQIKLLTSQ